MTIFGHPRLTVKAIEVNNNFLKTWYLLLLLTAGPLIFAQDDARIGSGKTAEEYPVLNPAATELYFSRPDFKNNQGRDKAADIWMRTRDAAGRWNRAINVGSPINSSKVDRALGFSADGNRLAVLRGTNKLELEILQRDGRGWVSRALTRVPGTIGRRTDIAYNLATGELIYAYGEGTAATNLYSMKWDGKANWSPPTPVTELNSAVDESRPFFAADGRTLYFFRSGQGWFRQTDRGAEPELTRVPISAKQFTVGLTTGARNQMAVVSIAPNANLRELRGMTVANNDYPPSGRVLDALTSDGKLALSSGITLQQMVEHGNRTSVFLRPDERIIDGEELTDLDEVGIPVGGLYANSNIVGVGSEGRINRLRQRISDHEAELMALERRRAAILDQADYDRMLALEQRIKADTFPKSAAEQRRLEQQLAEIEAMKAKFNQQQNERQRINDGGSRRRASSDTYGRAPVAYDKPRSPQPDIDEGLAESGLFPKGGNVSNLPSRELAEIRERQRQDSINRASVLSGPAPTPYGSTRGTPQSWEYDLQRTLPSNQRALSEAARIDEQYQRQQAEVEALRAELARLKGQSTINRSEPLDPATGQGYRETSYTPPADYGRPATPGTWTARGSGADVPVTNNNDRRANRRRAAPANNDYRPASTAPGEVIDLTFVANTAYIDGRGYGGVEQLYRIIQEARGVVEVRIHTPMDMDRRAAQLLSEERAKTIELELIDRGIAERHFRILGFGNNETGKGGERVEVRY